MPNNPTKPLMEIRHLNKAYVTDVVKTPVLHGLNFTVKPGEFVAIMGPSGSGKSTLLHILGLLDTPTSGQYLLEGKDTASLAPPDLAQTRNKKMGFVFQSFNLLSRTSVLENVKLPLLYSDVRENEWDQRAQQAIEQVGLAHRLNHVPSQLSGGEKQRTAIARALITKPEIIFADEPTGNLDSKSGQAIMEILQKLNQQGGHTIILITHETDTAEHAERIINIRDGLIESDIQVRARRQVRDFVK